MDEVATIHELPIDPLRNALNAGGLLYFTWVIPGAIFVMIVGLSYLRFLGHLPSRTRNLFLIAAAVFVGGAIGVEMISGLQADRHGETNFAYAMIITIEEAMEMLGVVIFIHAVADYLHRTVGELHIQFASGAEDVPNCYAGETEPYQELMYEVRDIQQELSSGYGGYDKELAHADQPGGVLADEGS